MFNFEVKWKIAFKSNDALNQAFGDSQKCVAPSPYGEVLWIREGEQLHAFKNKCPHQNKPLNNCWLEGDQIVCPFHRYHFSLENGRGHGTSMYKFEVRIEKGAVWLGKEVFRLF